VSWLSKFKAIEPELGSIFEQNAYGEQLRAIPLFISWLDLQLDVIKLFLCSYYALVSCSSMG